MIKILICLLFISGLLFAFDYPLLPDFKLTPGEVDTNLTIDVITNPEWSTRKVRNVPKSEKMKVFAEYHIDLTKYKTSDFEIDHLISLELGGANDIKNLWPQSYFGAINAHQKDRLENYLHKMVKEGKIKLSDAQVMIATNWIEAYNSMFHTNLWLLTNN